MTGEALAPGGLFICRAVRLGGGGRRLWAALGGGGRRMPAASGGLWRLLAAAVGGGGRRRNII